MHFYFRAALKHGSKVLLFGEDRKAVIHKFIPSRAAEKDFNMVYLYLYFYIFTLEKLR